jgi:hypothetical protein
MGPKAWTPSRMKIKDDPHSKDNKRKSGTHWRQGSLGGFTRGWLLRPTEIVYEPSRLRNP